MRLFKDAQECGDEVAKLRIQGFKHLRYIPYELATGGWVIGVFVVAKRKEDQGEIFMLPNGFV